MELVNQLAQTLEQTRRDVLEIKVNLQRYLPLLLEEHENELFKEQIGCEKFEA